MPTPEPTVAQVVASAYDWATDDLEIGRFYAPDECGPVAGDTLQQFLWREFVEQVSEANADDWDLVRERAALVFAQVQSVVWALNRYGPQPQEA